MSLLGRLLCVDCLPPSTLPPPPIVVVAVGLQLAFLGGLSWDCVFTASKGSLFALAPALVRGQPPLFPPWPRLLVVASPATFFPPLVVVSSLGRSLLALLAVCIAFF